jgi:SAM-dependent methyltransferase
MPAPDQTSPLPAPPTADTQGSADTRAAPNEVQSVRERYARRVPQDSRYSLRNPAAMLSWQERLRAMVGLFAELGLPDLAGLRLLEIGCGTGGNLLDAMRLGFAPEHLAGVELLADRHGAARQVLPAGVQLWQGDATAIDLGAASWDIVWQSTVFSSLLDDGFQQRLADTMWRYVRPGGGVLWHDFTVDNPRNRDVRGVPLARVRALFPQASRIVTRRITLAPPIARAVTRVHPALYPLLNTLPALRTHVLIWLAKP